MEDLNRGYKKYFNIKKMIKRTLPSLNNFDQNMAWEPSNL